MSAFRRLMSKLTFGFFKAHYDAADTSDENRRHWRPSNGNDATRTNDPPTRKTLRDRSREEARNNCYAIGMLDKLATDMIGTGPRLRLKIEGVSRKKLRRIERAWRKWAKSIDLAEDLRIMHISRVRDGESFAAAVTNRTLDPQGVRLDLRVYETEQIANPSGLGLTDLMDPNNDDGVITDDDGNPLAYNVLEQHPGGLMPYINKATKVPAKRMFHWYKPVRAGQRRGIPELTPALPLFAYLRRYTLATIGAAEIASMFAAVLETDAVPTDEGNEDGVKATKFDVVEFERNAAVSLGAGQTLKQLDAKQPVSNYGMFKGEVLSEIGAPNCMPKGVISGDSSSYNYSSGRLDRSPYQRMIRVDRTRMESRVLDPLCMMWLEEAMFVHDDMFDGLPPFSEWEWLWFWDGFDSIDAVKDATADQLNLANGTTTLDEIYAESGQDWEEHVIQRGIEIEMLTEMGIVAQATAPTVTIDNNDDTTVKPNQTKAAALRIDDLQSLMNLAVQARENGFAIDATVAMMQLAFPMAPRAHLARIAANTQTREPEVTCA